jgi:hypothetical protein
LCSVRLEVDFNGLAKAGHYLLVSGAFNRSDWSAVRSASTPSGRACFLGDLGGLGGSSNDHPKDLVV